MIIHLCEAAWDVLGLLLWQIILEILIAEYVQKRKEVSK